MYTFPFFLFLSLDFFSFFIFVNKDFFLKQSMSKKCKKLGYGGVKIKTQEKKLQKKAI